MCSCNRFLVCILFTVDESCLLPILGCRRSGAAISSKHWSCRWESTWSAHEFNNHHKQWVKTKPSLKELHIVRNGGFLNWGKFQIIHCNRIFMHFPWNKPSNCGTPHDGNLHICYRLKILPPREVLPEFSLSTNVEYRERKTLYTI